MMKRRLVWVGIAVCLALAVCLSAWLLSRPHPVNRANFQRIQVGMTLAEVEDILGPPGDHAGVIYLSRCRLSGRWPESERDDQGAGFEWMSNEGEIAIWFDEDRRVAKTRFWEPQVCQPPVILDRIHSRLGW